MWYSIYSPDVEAGLYKLNFTTHQVVDTILVPTLQPYGIAWDGTYLLYVENGFQGDPQGVFKVNPVTGDTAGFIPAPVDPNGTRPNSVAWDGRYMWLLAEPVGSNTGRSLYKYDLSGGGTPDILLVPSSLDFGNKRLNTRYVDSIRIQNVGTGPLRIDSISSIPTGVWDTDFQPPVTIAPNAFVTMRIGFRPNLFGVYTLFVALSTNDPDEPVVNLNVRGVGIFGPPTISTTSDYDFGARRVGSSNTWRMLVQNYGATPLVISSITVANPAFRIDSVAYPVTIDSLGSRTFRVWFTPTSAGLVVDSLRISSNASNGPITPVALRGTGDAAPVPIGVPLWTYTVVDHPISNTFRLTKAVRAIGDITGDGKPEVVVSTENYWTMALNGNA
ncbi:MAG: choice-of-anchor D domain-containing protein, partial [Bacteroidota bacterium]